MNEPEDFQAVTLHMFRLYGEGHYAQALAYVEAKAAAFPEYAARTTFWRACLLSQCDRTEDAIAALQNGLDAGHWWHTSFFRDRDLDAIRDLPAFQNLTARSQESWEQARTQAKPQRTVLVPDGAGPHPLLIVLHGHGGNKDSNLEHWEAARRLGWLVLSPQSSQALDPNSFFWDDLPTSIADIRIHLEEIRSDFRVEAERSVVGGFSQGSGMAILTALASEFPARGFLAAGTWWENVADIQAAARAGKPVRGYFVTGLKDHALERTREIQAVLKENGVPFGEETHPDLGHEFPPEFGHSFETALKYILG